MMMPVASRPPLSRTQSSHTYTHAHAHTLHSWEGFGMPPAPLLPVVLHVCPHHCCFRAHFLRRARCPPARPTTTTTAVCGSLGCLHSSDHPRVLYTPTGPSPGSCLTLTGCGARVVVNFPAASSSEFKRNPAVDRQLNLSSRSFGKWAPRCRCRRPRSCLRRTAAAC